MVKFLETVLGLVGTKIGDKIQKLFETKGYDDIKKYLKKCYGKELVDSYEKAYGKEGVLELARTNCKTWCII